MLHTKPIPTPTYKTSDSLPRYALPNHRVHVVVHLHRLEVSLVLHGYLQGILGTADLEGARRLVQVVQDLKKPKLLSLKLKNSEKLCLIAHFGLKIEEK